MIANLLNLRNIAIIAGLCATAFAVQSLRINWLKTDKRELKIELLKANHTIRNYKEASQTNQITIAELQQANQQCAQSRELNEQTAEQELARQHGRIADINNKYNELRKNLPNKGCLYDVHIDDALLEQLYKD